MLPTNIHKVNLFFVFVSIMLMISTSAIAQSLTGLAGGYSIPTASFHNDKTVIFGYNYLNNKYYDLYSLGKNYSHSIGYLSLTFLPFAEVSVRVTYPNGFNRDHDINIIGDRMISGRLHPLKEGKYHPSVVIGLQGFYKTTGGSGLLNIDGKGASHFNSSFIVLTKNFHPPRILSNLKITVGYGDDFIGAHTYQFIGLFYGLSFSPINMSFIELMLEYDAEKWNAGTRVTVLKHLILLAGVEGLDKFSGGVAFKFQLP
jgi:hypothetical protein